MKLDTDMLTVVLLSVIMLNVVAPQQYFIKIDEKKFENRIKDTGNRIWNLSGIPFSAKKSQNREQGSLTERDRLVQMTTSSR
jgi:hypothetical protein